MAGLRSTFATSGAPPGLAMHLTGSLAQNVDEEDQSGQTQLLTELLSVLFILALLFLTFRALLAPFVALLPSAVALIAAGPVIAVSSHLGVQVSDLTPILLVVVLLGAGTDYGLFLIFRVREELRRGKDVDEAVSFSLCKVGESITFSGLTVVGALATVVVATFGLYQGLGPALAIGIAVALLANLTLLPALLAVLGRSVFWPRIPRAGVHKGGTWGRIAGKVVGRPGAHPDHRPGHLRRPGPVDAGLRPHRLQRPAPSGHLRLRAGPGHPQRRLPAGRGRPHLGALRTARTRCGRTPSCWPPPNTSCPGPACSPRSPVPSTLTASRSRAAALAEAREELVHLGPAAELPAVPRPA